ncbi:HalOD1 output domain-containing protein [Halovenus rubra]|uniref:HalOD1 output domain-containing protein n=2 Tax=Halovenus rubra TaxID=869890 RepID=A0ABD5X7Q5_9EURY|nr:HalOD1 output domain-containing protein [Halovenus rubra]
MSERNTVINEVIDRVAELENKHSESLPPLAKTIDPDALEVLASDVDRIEFTYLGYCVVVTGEEIQVNEINGDNKT